MDSEDWLKDPLVEIDQRHFKYLKPKNSSKEQAILWKSFHIATRLKLEGAEFFCRQVLGAASMPDYR